MTRHNSFSKLLAKAITQLVGIATLFAWSGSQTFMLVEIDKDVMSFQAVERRGKVIDAGAGSVSKAKFACFSLAQSGLAAACRSVHHRAGMRLAVGQRTRCRIFSWREPIWYAGK